MPVAKVNWVFDYRILVSDATQRPNAELCGFNLGDRIPLFSLPLGLDDNPVFVNLQLLLQKVYDQGNFDLRIDYNHTVPEPALSESDRAWVQHSLTYHNTQ